MHLHMHVSICLCPAQKYRLPPPHDLGAVLYYADHISTVLEFHLVPNLLKVGEIFSFRSSLIPQSFYQKSCQGVQKNVAHWG